MAMITGKFTIIIKISPAYSKFKVNNTMMVMFKLKTCFMQHLYCHHTTLLQHGCAAPTHGLKLYTNGNNVFSNLKILSSVVQ